MGAFDVAVIVPAFGDEQYAMWARARAIPSAERQAFDGTMELIIVDRADCIADARNVGAARAQSEWLCFLDADDEIEPGYLAAMSRATADLRGPATTFVRVDGEREGPLLVRPRPLEDSNYLVIGTLVRRELFARVGGFNPRWPVHEDYDLWLRCERRAQATIEQVPDAVYVVHQRRGSRNLRYTVQHRLRINRAIQADR